jgi:hypothetical protein
VRRSPAACISTEGSLKETTPNPLFEKISAKIFCVSQQPAGRIKMKYECIYDPDLDTIEATTHGLADLTTLIEMMHRIAELCRKQISANILVDHSDLDAGFLHMSEVETLSSASVSLKEAFGMRKCAHVVGNELQLGLVRAWEIMAEMYGLTDLEMMDFNHRDEAIQWLTSGA